LRDLDPFRLFAWMARTVRIMVILVIIILVLWVILAIVGFAIKGLFWLALIGIVLFVATLIISLIRRNVTKKRNL
jgi:hypothetical protein